MNDLTSLLQSASSEIIGYKKLALSGFGLASSLIFLLIGLIYLWLLNKNTKGGCQKDLENFVRVMGMAYLIAAVILLLFKDNKFAKSLLVVFPGAMLLLQVWGYYVLLRPEGLSCLVGGSPLWLPAMILNILATAGLGSMGGIGGAMNISK